MAQVTRTCQSTNIHETTTAVAYCIGSDLDATAEQVNRNIRGHWACHRSDENQLHWVLDRAFREDEMRHHARNSAQNLTVLRHFAWHLLKRDTYRKVGIAACRKRVGWDRDYLITLMTCANG